MPDREVFFHIGKDSVLPWSTTTSGSRSIGLDSTVAGIGTNVMTVNFFLVSKSARSASPAISSRGFGGQWRLDTPHVEPFFAAIA